jgi:hypothetical protein
VALFNEVLAGRFNAVLTKLLDMHAGAPAPTLATDITPAIVLEQDRPEWHFLGGSYLAAGKLSQAADVANLSVVGLFNGQTTGVIAVVEKIIIVNSGVAALFQIKTGQTTGLSNTIRGQARDLRWGSKQSACLIGNATPAAPGTGNIIAEVVLPATTTIQVDLNVVLPENTNQTGNVIPNIIVSSTALNTAVSATFIWRERFREASESR